MTDRNQPTRYLAFDIVHAVEFSRIGRTWHVPVAGSVSSALVLFAGGWLSLEPLTPHLQFLARSKRSIRGSRGVDFVPREAGKLFGFPAPLG